jgi:hypothetical protein
MRAEQQLLTHVYIGTWGTTTAVHLKPLASPGVLPPAPLLPPPLPWLAAAAPQLQQSGWPQPQQQQPSAPAAPQKTSPE